VQAKRRRLTRVSPGLPGFRDRRWSGFLVAALVLPCCAVVASNRAVLKSESGFPGAVTVAAEESDGDLLVATANIPYLDVRAKPAAGQARLFVLRDGIKSGQPHPVFFSATYELEAAIARRWCSRGWIVVTPHYGQYGQQPAIGDGFNLDHAIVEWTRRLPLVDRSHLQVNGSSQGAYMALCLAADFLPIEAVTADAPILNWDYNLCYLLTNKAAAEFGHAAYDKSPLPFLCPVIPLADQAVQLFGSDLTSDNYYGLSPISFLDRVTSPVLLTWSTADMLVPLDQATRTRLARFDGSRFPTNYHRAFDLLTGCKQARKVLEDVVLPSSLHWDVLPLPENPTEFLMSIALAGQSPTLPKPAYQDLPWSPNHQWSFCLLDEGSPVPSAGHRRYLWSAFPDSFVAAYRQRPPAVALLNQAKLEYLLQRYTAHLDHPPSLAGGKSANRLNYAPIEEWDVVTGLLDYAGLGEAYAQNLRALYASGSRHPFGRDLDLAVLRKRRPSL